jgi:peroxiredoxin
MMSQRLASFAIALALGFIATAPVSAQAQAQAPTPDIKPVTVMQPMPDFTLPVLQGGEVTLSKLRGRNVLLIFPRGLVGEGSWCHVDNYQYADQAEMDKLDGFRKAFNLDVLFVLPYGEALVRQWADKFADQMQDIENGKNPADPAKLDAQGRARMDAYRRNFPKKYVYEKGKVPFPFPVLIDADRRVSKGLGLFTTEWGGRKSEQNIPTVFVIDTKGIVRLKYISQNTYDRPSTEYLLGFLERILRSDAPGANPPNHP